MPLLSLRFFAFPLMPVGTEAKATRLTAPMSCFNARTAHALHEIAANRNSVLALRFELLDDGQSGRSKGLWN